MRPAVRGSESTDRHGALMNRQTTSTRSRSRSSSLLVRLQRDWDHLAVSSTCLATARGWRLDTAPFDSLDELLRRAGYGIVARGAHGDDHVLAGLVLAARTDPLAARIVLQRLLPGIAATARRRAGSPMAHDDTVGDLVAAAWTVIRTYPADTRPSYIAANLLRRIDDAAFRRHRRRLGSFTPWPTEFFDQTAATEPPGPSSADELNELLDLARIDGWSAGDLRLIRRLADGESTRIIASDLRVTDRTVRNRRAALTRRLADLAHAS